MEVSKKLLKYPVNFKIKDNKNSEKNLVEKLLNRSVNKLSENLNINQNSTSNNLNLTNDKNKAISSNTFRGNKKNLNALEKEQSEIKEKMLI